MRSKLIELKNLSGSEASIYSILEETVSNKPSGTLYSRFINDYKIHNIEEVLNINQRLKSIGNTTGCDVDLFKLDEGLESDDLVCALYDVPMKHLRLYCLRLSEKIVIVGGGGPKTTRTWQEDPLLSRKVHSMMHISGIIRAKLKAGNLRISASGLKLLGDLSISKI